MSLINQMLRDLDARNAGRGGAALPNDVRPLPAGRASPLPALLGGLAVAGAGVLAFVFWPASPAPTPPVASTLPAASTPAAPVAAPAEAVPAGQAAETVPPLLARSGSPDGSGGLRRADSITLPAAEKAAAPAPAPKVPVEPAAKAPAKPEVKSVATRPEPEAKPKSEAKPSSKPEAKPEPKTEPKPLAEAPAGSRAPVRIERSEVGAAPRERADAAYRQAVEAVSQGRAGEAVDGLQRALEQDSLHAPARQLLVRILLEQKKIETAMQVLRDGLQLQPQQAGWAMSLARLQLERGDPAAAWQTLEASAPAASASPDYQGFCGHVLHRLGRSREAAAYYQNALRLAPGEGRWWLGLGLAYEAEGRASEARGAFLSARQSGTLNADLTALVEQKLR